MVEYEVGDYVTIKETFILAGKTFKIIRKNRQHGVYFYKLDITAEDIGDVHYLSLEEILEGWQSCHFEKAVKIKKHIKVLW